VNPGRVKKESGILLNEELPSLFQQLHLRRLQCHLLPPGFFLDASGLPLVLSLLKTTRTVWEQRSPFAERIITFCCYAQIAHPVAVRGRIGLHPSIPRIPPLAAILLGVSGSQLQCSLSTPEVGTSRLTISPTFQVQNLDFWYFLLAFSTTVKSSDNYLEFP